MAQPSERSWPDPTGDGFTLGLARALNERWTATATWNDELERQRAEREAQDRAEAEARQRRARAIQDRTKDRTPAQAQASRPAAANPSPSITGDVWWDLAGCESTWTNDTGDPFWGFFQFTLDTWHSMGESGHPSDYGYDYQRGVAQRLQAVAGFRSQWPACSRKLGLR